MEVCKLLTLEFTIARKLLDKTLEHGKPSVLKACHLFRLLEAVSKGCVKIIKVILRGWKTQCFVKSKLSNALSQKKITYLVNGCRFGVASSDLKQQ